MIASGPNMPIAKYLQLLKRHGHLAQIGAPEDDVSSFPKPLQFQYAKSHGLTILTMQIAPFSMFGLLGKGVSMGGSLIGGRQEIKDMLQLWADNGVKAWTNKIPMSEANRAIVRQAAGKARYRIVLVNEKHL